MSVVENAKSFPVTEFGGTKSQIDPIDLEPTDALVAKNCVFAPGKVSTRTGFASYYVEAGSTNVISSVYYFTQQTAFPDWVAFIMVDLSTSNIYTKMFNIVPGGGGTVYTVLTSAAASTVAQAVFASFGARLYAAITYPAVPTYLPKVWDSSNTSNQMIDCFQRPMKTSEVTEALTQPGAGVITAGTHYVGVLFQTKPGYWTKPGPANTSTLALVPQSIVSTGTANIRVTLTPASTWPTWISKVQVIMTTADNSFQYYVVPGTITSVTSGSATVYTIDISISDLQLTSIGSQGAGTLADDYFSLLSMDASNVQPFNVKAVVQWGQRLVWVATYGGVDSLFPSDPLNPEWISADQHLLQLPGGRPIGSVFVMRGVLYAVSSAGGLFAWVDNGGRPITFSPPATADEHVMCPGFYCVSVSASGGLALLASPQGLYAYTGGAFPSVPLSLGQTPDYETLFWTTGILEQTQVIDMSTSRLIILRANTRSGSGYSTATMFVWDYQDGLSANKVRFSKWSIVPPAPNQTLCQPSLCVARIDGLWQLLVSLFGNTIYRQTSPQAADSGATLYTDLTSTGIDWQYQTAPLPVLPDAPMLQHLGARLRVRALTGTPALLLSSKSLDDVRSFTIPLSPLTLAVSPGKEYLALYDAQEERVSYLFTNNSVAGAGISLASLTHFYDFFAEER